MKNLWNEFVNSLGFALSAVIVILIIPMAFTFVMGAAGDAEAVGGLIFVAVVVGVPLYLWMKQPTMEQKEEKLWIEEKKAEPRPRATFTGKLLETTVEMEERLDVRKRQHFQKLERRVYWKYRAGESVNWDRERLSIDMWSYLKRDKTLRFTVDYESFLGLPPIVETMMGREGTYPHKVLEATIDEYIAKRGGKSRDFMENNKKELLEEFRWAVNYAALHCIFCFHNFFKVSLSSDMREYKIEYPFNVPPLKYCFDSTEEEEEEVLARGVAACRGLQNYY